MTRVTSVHVNDASERQRGVKGQELQIAKLNPGDAQCFVLGPFQGVITNGMNL